LIIKRYRANAYRRESIKTLFIIEKRFESTQEFECVNEAMAVVKQVAIVTYGRNKVADLSGDHWLQFLDDNFKTETFVPFSSVIQTALYQNKISNIESTKPLFSVIKNWIKKHA
jgi:hypothetical protein